MMQSLRKKYESLFRGELLNSCAPFLSYSFIEIAGSVLTGLIVAALCGVLIWLRVLSKR